MNKKSLRSIMSSLLFLLSFGLSVSGRAGEMPIKLHELNIEELMEVEFVTVASTFEQKISEAPASISIITADEIKRYGWRNLSEILRSVKSFYVTYDRLWHYLGVRGFKRAGDYNSRFLILVDGRRTNDNIYDYSSLEATVDIDIIKRIEVVRGPGSSLYGANAFLGVINIITKQAVDAGGAELSGEAGRFDSRKGRITYGKRFENGIGLLLSASKYESAGNGELYFREFDDPATNNGIASNVDGERADNLFLKLSLSELQFSASHFSRDKTDPAAYFGAIFNDPANRASEEWRSFDLKYESAPSAERSGMLRLFYSSYDYEEDLVYDYPPRTIYRSIASGRWWGGELRLTGRFAESHTLVAGAEYRNNFRQQMRDFEVAPFYSYLDIERYSDLWGIYIQDEYRVRESVILNMGIRYDHFWTFGYTANPRLALLYNPAESSTVKLVYGTSYRAPNAYESYYNDSNVTRKANPALEPEEIVTYELILEQYFNKNISMSISAFSCRIKELIEETTDPADGLLVFENRGRVESKGGEIEARWNWRNGLRGILSYSWQESMDRNTGLRLTDSPEQMGKLNLTVPLVFPKLFAGLEVQYTGERKSLSWEKVDSFVLTNITLTADEVLKGLDISATVYNFFDETCYDPASLAYAQDSIRQDGRTYRVKAAYRF